MMEENTIASQQPEQRVGVFIDVQNLYHSAKHLYNTKLNFTRALEAAVAGRSLIRAFAYVIKADVDAEEDFFNALRKMGIEVRVKELKQFFGGNKKGDWDVGIAMDIMKMARKLDTIVLLSGDGDFEDLIKYVKSLGCRPEVMAFEQTTSSDLKREAKLFTDLGKNKFVLGNVE